MSDTLLADENGIEESKYLVFRLANELYASPLIAVREIIKMQPIKPVPFMVHYFRGILNLRGLIVSVVDLRLKFDFPNIDLASGLLVVVESAEGTIGAVVDDVISVHSFPKENIETNLPLKTKIPLEFFVGVSHYNDRLVNIVDIGSTLTSDDLAMVRTAKKTGSQAGVA